ncbi:unnamed protein product [Nippostrongylus brasiliensis]|uniref:tRNA-dihydrouridine(47) synthase [NAD(P)(+)] n=1 Tax=Nippostrongylus brasiliensis TaxID=27835 RepID=A0A158QZQ3_NIPBR|nr:unnamed protein product [Nippostrongylus brasiliensis]
MCDPVPSSSSSVPPSGSSDSATNTARKRGKSAAEKRDTANRLHVLDSHMRINFLHQGAMFLSCQSSGLDDGYAKLSRRYAKLLRDVLKTERVKIKPDIGQTFCRKCHQVFVGKMSTQDVEGICETIDQFSLNVVRTGTAAVKAEFLVERDSHESGDGVSGQPSDDCQHGSDSTETESNSERKNEEKKARKGMNKNRRQAFIAFLFLKRIRNDVNFRKEMKQAETIIRASNARLCPSVIQPVKCKFGEKCNLEHDISSFLAKKPEDIADVCPLFNARGTCPFSYACRFGGEHIDSHGNQLCKEPDVPYQEVMNSSSIHIQIALRKRTFDFKRSDDVISALKSGTLGAMEREKPIMDMRTLKGKKYLAPLTTVGNLPFRRLCVNLGADITCGEMALATSLLSVLSAMRAVMGSVPLTVKIRTGIREGSLTADETIRTMQRYTRLANWDFVNPCLRECGEVPLWVCGDVLSWEDYYSRLDDYPIDGIMIGRGALIKPWIFTEIDERRTWDISASERLDLMKQFVNYGLDHWGSDDAGVERTRRFLLEWLSFQCRYIPVGILERLPQRMNDRPPLYRGRNELETLLSSHRAADWISISVGIMKREASAMDWTSLNGADAKPPVLTRGDRQQQGQQGEAVAAANGEVDDDLQAAPGIEGIKFVYNVAPDGTLDKGAHMYTYRSSLLASTREWLPCVDAPDQLALWHLHITCESWMTVIASGDLVGFESDPSNHLRTWNYKQLIPTSACSIGFVVGQFSTHTLPDMAEVTNFAPVGLLSLLKHTVTPLDKVFEYFEELLSCRFPYPTYKQVFVDMESRQLLAFGVAQQFFGCFITPAHFLDSWLVRSLSRFITSLYIEKIFGTSEYLFQIKKLLNAVCEYESQWGKIILRPSGDGVARLNLHCDPRSEHTASPLYVENQTKKGHLAMRMLSKRLGNEPYFQVLHKILSVGQQMAERRDKPATWTHLVITTETFFRTVTNVTGQEIPTFLEQWVQYVFNRKRNMIELEVKQKVEPGNGRLRYVGPLTVLVQELDGSFSHTVQIDGDVSRADLQCHSKGRRQKKKRVPLYSGDDVEVDLSNMDPDSPVLWIRIDPELHLIRNLMINQPDYQWEYMLRYERDVLAQLQALERLQLCPNPQSRDVLLETISNENFFYRVRCHAAFALTEVLNKMPETWSGIPALLSMYKKVYGAKSCPAIPKSNNFVVTSQYLQQYFLQQALPQALARMRTNGMALQEVQCFIVDYIRYNDNSINRYSDDHYRASLLNALAACIAPVTTLGGVLPAKIFIFGGNRWRGVEAAQSATPKCRETTHALNLDTIKPTFRHVVGVAALTVIHHLQRNGHIPSDSKIFWTFAAPKLCVNMRKVALRIIIERLSLSRKKQSTNDLMRLLTMLSQDADPAIRLHIATELALMPPFSAHECTDTGPTNPCNTPQIAEELWMLMSKTLLDERVRLLLTDVFFSLYGMSAPFVKGGPAMISGHQRAKRRHTDGRSAVISWHNDILDGEQPPSPESRSFNEDIDMLQ